VESCSELQYPNQKELDVISVGVTNVGIGNGWVSVFGWGFYLGWDGSTALKKPDGYVLWIHPSSDLRKAYNSRYSIRYRNNLPRQYLNTGNQLEVNR
jgi:hypothetical protein